MRDLQQIRSTFDRDGFGVVPDIISPQRLAEIRRHVDGVLDGTIRPTRDGRPGSTAVPDDFQIQWEPAVADRDDLPRRDKVRIVFHMAHVHPFFWDVATDPAIVDVVEALIGPNIRYYTDQMFVKPAHHGSEVPWHHDSSYWRMAEPKLLSCWLAIDDVTIENGCVRFIPGTHEADTPHHVVESRTANNIAARPEYVEESREVPVQMKAGSASFHHSLTLHRSLPNTSDKGRRGMIMIYLPADLKLYKPWPSPFEFPLIRGSAPAPKLQLIEQA